MSSRTKPSTKGLPGGLQVKAFCIDVLFSSQANRTRSASTNNHQHGRATLYRNGRRRLRTHLAA